MMPTKKKSEKDPKRQISVWLSETGREIVEALASRDGCSNSVAIERLLREKARELELDIKGLD